ncbi:uncharacterized protein LOC121919522 isoform X3 [Sceloporus undulatus]|uniref:uncharacterized protein LOC121919522 isoform X3 n=1 Tax=Sceloporus undulatus TaxID=8520 RepID=UPI001C4D6487|nr:uncharacterized protein LOC121919522 isoform X3 [Sceloporus undulatus]
MMMMMVVVQRGRVPGGAAEPLPSVPLPLLLLHLLLFLGPIWAEGGRRAATPWASQAQPPPLHWQPETPPLKETASAEGKMEGSTTGSHSPTGLSYAVAASQILGLAVVTMMGAWMGHFRGGLAWDSPQLQFNVHPLCMTLGMVFLQADALLVFRVFRNESKRATKILHGLLHSLALVVALGWWPSSSTTRSRTSLTSTASTAGAAFWPSASTSYSGWWAWGSSSSRGPPSPSAAGISRSTHSWGPPSFFSLLPRPSWASWSSFSSRSRIPMVPLPPKGSWPMPWGSYWQPLGPSWATSSPERSGGAPSGAKKWPSPWTSRP